MSTISLEFGVEELLFLLSVLQIPTLAGLGDDPFQGLTTDQKQRALAAGLNSLNANHFISQPSEGGSGLIVDSSIVALIGTCATAPKILTINRTSAAGVPEVAYVHFGPHLTTFHEKRRLGVHELYGTVDTNVTLQRIANLLHLNSQQIPISAEIQLLEEEFSNVTTAVRENRAVDAIDVLLKRSASNELAQHLVDSLRNIQANSMIALLEISPTSDTVSTEGFALLESSIGFWVITSEDGHTPMVHLSPIGSQDCLNKIAMMTKLTA